MNYEYWDEHSIELDRIFKTLKGKDIDARTINLNKNFLRNKALQKRFKTMSYNGDLKSQDVLKFFKLNMSNKLSEDNLTRRDVLLHMVND